MLSSSRAWAAVGAAAMVWAGAGRGTMAQTPTPKPPAAADWAALAKLPDFSGVWEAARGGRPGDRGATGPSQGPALTLDYAAKRKARQDGGREDNETANCLPPGMPIIMGQPYPMEFLLTPGQVTVIIEAYQQVRHIYTDGRPLPADPDPTFQGTSIGRWDGGTLVVDTVGFSSLTLLAPDTPHGENMRIKERFTLVDPDTMTIETTITDPEALTAPFVSTRTLRRHRDWTLAEYVCEQNNRNFVDQNGKAGVRLSAPAK